MVDKLKAFENNCSSEIQSKLCSFLLIRMEVCEKVHSRQNQLLRQSWINAKVWRQKG